MSTARGDTQTGAACGQVVPLSEFEEVGRDCACGRSLNDDGITCRKHGARSTIYVQMRRRDADSSDQEVQS